MVPKTIWVSPWQPSHTEFISTDPLVGALRLVVPGTEGAKFPKLLRLDERCQMLFLFPGWWLVVVVEPTHLKNMLDRQIGWFTSSPSFGVKIQKRFELPPPSFLLGRNLDNCQLATM